ncbi:hypothetical protein KKE92_02935 [Candidatus Micrarchaeota archaeon]|nr:hypothetical protein [Candidatus Micrarchaeota archaeon]
MEKNKKALAGLVTIAIFIMIIFYVPKFVEQGTPSICIVDGNCQHEEYLESVINNIPAILLFGFLIGVVTSYFYFERKIEVPIPQKDDKKAWLSLLQPSERKVIAKIVENKGKVLQSELSRIEGVGKVKAHRVIERLIKRGVIEKEQIGKTNVLRLTKDLEEAFVKKD